VALTEVQYNVSERSSITATGAYGTLQFLDPGFIDSRYWIFSTGYNHRLSRRDEIAVTYVQNWFKFGGPNQEFLNRGFAILYGHQITGRFSLQLSVAPLFNQSGQPLGGAITKSFWSTFDSLQYRSPRWDAALSFERMIGGGSGVLPGAETDLAQATIGRQLSKRIRSSLQFSHSYSQSLSQESTLVRRSKYEFWQAGLNLSREFGPHISMYVNYSGQRQISNNPLCVGSNCATVFLRQVGGIGINWHARPVKID
jgi:hypothetical protein